MKIFELLMLAPLLASAACASGSRAAAGPRAAPTSEPAPVESLRADLPRFRVYAGDGSPASLAEIVAALDDVSVLFVGEEHDDSIAHRLEHRLLDEAVERHPDRPVVVSLEMFERDVQEVVDEYLDGLVTEPYFLEDARAWDRYAASYRPLVETAKDRGLDLVAANAPRRYVNLASRLGLASLEGLGSEGLESLPPLPLPEPSEAYRARWDSAMVGSADHAGMPEHMFDGQRLWDATMAHAVAAALFARPDALVLHYTGSFHVERDLGTAELLLNYRPGTRFLVVTIHEEEDPGRFDPERHAGLGDYVILTAK